MAEDKSTVLFKKIDGPLGLRRSVLESSKQMVHGLQKYERLKAVRVKKAQEIARLKILIKEINNLTAKLKKEFPDLVFKAPPKKAEPKKKAPAKAAEKKSATKKAVPKSVEKKTTTKAKAEMKEKPAAKTTKKTTAKKTDKESKQ